MKTATTSPSSHVNLSEVAKHARQRFANCVAESAGGSSRHWWTAVAITASSSRQAERYQEEISRRLERSLLPSGARYLAIPDPDDTRIGSGGATLHALRVLTESSGVSSSLDSLTAWWESQRVLVIHSGGDSRRLPQYSLSGKLFSALPVETPWGEPSTVFDEFLALSTSWVERLSRGLLVASGDVILTFDVTGLHWDGAGVSGVAMHQPIGVGVQHGVYVTGEKGRVYSFLQKPTEAQLRAAGGIFPGEMVALDTGLLRFAPEVAARLTELARSPDEKGLRKSEGKISNLHWKPIPFIDLYEHFTGALTGQWRLSGDAPFFYKKLSKALRRQPFSCDLVQGDFTHVGSTTLFRQLMTEESNFSQLYQVQQRLGMISPANVRSAGVIIDSTFSAGGDLGPGSLVIECEFSQKVKAGRGAILHGIFDLREPLEVPDNTVIHHIPVMLPDGRRGTVVRVYGVADNPKVVGSDPIATWQGRPFLEMLRDLELDLNSVWPGLEESQRTLWNALLFPFGNRDEVWTCAYWMMGLTQASYRQAWLSLPRLSLATSSQYADGQALAAARSRRMQNRWQTSALALAQAGSDIRPLLQQSPGVAALAATGRALAAEARAIGSSQLTEAASRHFQSYLFLSQAGLAEEAAEAHRSSFSAVQQAVDQGAYETGFENHSGRWLHQQVDVSAPARIDFGGGWSDTPPFCLDWGGTVLNAALAIGGGYPIQSSLRRLSQPVIRCVTEDTGDMVEYQSTDEILSPLEPGNPFGIPRVALQMTGLLRSGEPLTKTLARLGGGIEIRTTVKLPMGSGLGTSSILSASLLQALAEMLGVSISRQSLVYQVMRLEQLLTTGGGWQDQVGGIFPGFKLAMSGPGLRQRVRVEPLEVSAEHQREFLNRFLLYYTGIRRIAKDLLVQVVGRYLAREVAAVQVLHSIKTLATEMAYAMRDGEWDYLGSLMNRHWGLNQILDPNTTNSLINALLHETEPYTSGAKLAGAGGGGFLMLLAKDADAAQDLRKRLAKGDLSGNLYQYQIASSGLRITKL